MKRFQILGVALIAVFAFSVVIAASASATVVFLLAEWLVNGLAVTTNLNVQTEGELLLEDINILKAGIKAKILCSGFLDGTIGPTGEGLINEILSLNGTLISSTPLVGLSFECVSQEGCAAGSANLWPVNLPWPTLLDLIEESPFVGFGILILGKPGFYIQCTIAGITATDTCTAETESVAEATNETGGVTGTDSEAFTELVGLKLGLCTSSGEETAILEGTGLEFTTETGTTLSVSSVG